MKEKWEDKLFKLSEKYCVHDDRKLNSCLYHIFKPVVEYALKEQREELLETLEGMEKEVPKKHDIKHPLAKETSILQHRGGFNLALKEIKEKLCKK